MRRELGQLSLADGLVEGGAGRNRQLERIAALVDWAAFERLLGEVYAAPVGRPSYGPVVLLKCLLLQQWYRLSDPGLEEALSDRLSLPALRRPGAGRSGARSLDPVALSQRADPAGPGRAAAGRAQPPARRPGADGQGGHPDRRLPGRGRLPAAAQGRAGRRAAATRMPAGTRCRRSRCSATRCTSRSTRARAWCAKRSSPPATSRTRCRSSIWSRATSGQSTPIAATTAGGIARSWPDAASPTASWPATTGSGRSMPPAMPATARSGRIRAPVERTFALLKRWYGYRRVRYRSLVKNTLQLQLLALALNLRRALVLTG